MLSYYPYTLDARSRRTYSYTRRKYLYHKQDKTGMKKSGDVNGENLDERSQLNDDEIAQEVEFSQSLAVSRPRSNSIESTASSFIQSFPPSVYSAHPAQSNFPLSRAQSKYDHNICNPDLLVQRCGSETELQKRRQNLFGRRNSSDRLKRQQLDTGHLKKSVSEGNCECGKYHSHTYASMRPKLATLCSVTSTDLQLSPKKLPEMIAGNENQTTICNTFWHAALVFSDYKHGNKSVEFSSLWPSEALIRNLLAEGVKDTGLRSALWELCLLSILSGPLSVLRGLLDQQIIRADYQFENDASLLHLACLLRNIDAVQLLLQHRASTKSRDKAGFTPGLVCFCPKMQKQLPAKLPSKPRGAVKPGLHDKDTIFKLASNPKSLYELQIKLQKFDFSANMESNEEGDFLIHTAARAGLCQLPLIMSLVRLQHVDIDMCNARGMTPLMVVAACGETIMCDALMCLFSANPNKKNERTGETALHYAIKANHAHVVNCLLKRGADMNIEDKEHCLPDDMPPSNTSVDDCREMIQTHRQQRCSKLSVMVQEDTIYPIDLRSSDLPVVNSEGSTLVMLAAENDRVHNLETLLGISTATINAQHWQTGLTALGKAASEGHAGACQVLLRFVANPNIVDMEGYLPIHRAVLNNHENVVDVFLKFFPTAFVGLSKAIKFAKKKSIQDKLKDAWLKRQEGIVGPELSLCSMQGNAERLYCVLEDGDQVNSKSILNNYPYLFMAVENGHMDVIHLLKEKGADLRKRDFETGNTVLHVIAKTGHLAIARYFLEFCKPHTTSGAERNATDRLDINAINNEKKTALQIAADRGYIKLTSLLIEYGATTSLLDAKGSLFTCPGYEGVRIQIETQRAEHTKQVMALVSDSKHQSKLQSAKNKRKTLLDLNMIWVPRFDHNIRNKNGDTPLMVACYRGHFEMVKFLLQTAVYANQLEAIDDSDAKSDDSGITDVPLPPWSSRGSVCSVEDLMKSIEDNGGMDETMGVSTVAGKSLNPGSTINSVRVNRGRRNGGAPYGGGFLADGADTYKSLLKTFIQDVERPKGLYIFHDGIVSHVCAVNLFDSCTPLHRAIQGGDNPLITKALVQADGAVINMQNAAGLTAVHLACKLGRRRILAQLLGEQGVDLCLLTLNGHLPEEMTTNKTIVKMVQKARCGHPVRPPPVDPIGGSPLSPSDGTSDGFPSTFSIPTSVGAQTKISLGKVEQLYVSMQASKANENGAGTLKYAKGGHGMR